MTSVTGPILSLEAQGQIGKGMISQKTLKGYSIRKYHQPSKQWKKESSNLNLINRIKYGSALFYWQSLSAAEQKVWNDQAEAQGGKISGFNLFLKRDFENSYNTQKLAGYWKLNERSGNYILDRSGNGFNMSANPSYPTNQITFRRSNYNRIGNVAYFPTNADCFQKLYEPKLQPSNTMTWCALFKPTSWVLSSDSAGIFWKSNGFGIRIEGTQGIRVYMYDVSYKSIQYLGGKKYNWYFICGVRNGANFRMLINGKLYGQINYSDSVSSGTDTISIGMQDPSRYFSGEIAECRLYKRVLSDSEILKLSRLLLGKFSY